MNRTRRARQTGRLFRAPAFSLSPAAAALLRTAGATTRTALTSIADLVFAPSCLSCGDGHHITTPGVPLCGACQDLLQESQTAVRVRCPRCANELGLLPSGATDCHDCRRHRPRFDRALAFGRYDGKLRELVLNSKKSDQTPVTRYLGVRLAEATTHELAGWPKIPDVVVPVPMHWSRRLARGVNGPDLLARPVADMLRVPLEPGLRRWRHTTLQKGLTPHQRRMNVRRAFRVRAGYDFRGARVLLVDDILTTGATVSEAAAVLKRQGAQWVGVAVVARTRRG